MMPLVFLIIFEFGLSVLADIRTIKLVRMDKWKAFAFDLAAELLAWLALVVAVRHDLNPAYIVAAAISNSIGTFLVASGVVPGTSKYHKKNKWPMSGKPTRKPRRKKIKVTTA